MEQGQSNVQSSPLVRGRVSVKNVDKIVCKWEVLEIIRTVTVHQTESGLPLAVQRHYLEVNGQQLKKVRSPTFRHTESSEWCMELSEQNGDTYLQFRLLSSQRDQSTKAKVNACLLSEDDEKFSVYSKEYVVLRAPQASARKKLHISNHNAYKLIGEVSVPAAAFVQVGGLLERQARRLGDDLGALLRSTEQADVLLCAGEREFAAHRAVLSARSPVFAAMLRHDTREARTGRVVVSDVDADTLRSFLHHLYTGRAPADARVDERLLAAADKYGVQDLKELCELEMARGLTADNAVAAGLAALANSCSLLKLTAVAFIKSNFAEVVGTDAWADAVKHHPDAVIELSRLIAVRHIN